MSELADTGGARRLRARWVLTADLVLRTAAHLGGQDEGLADLTVIRDRVDGVPLLPGTSLAGALRGHLSDRLGGYRVKEQDSRIARLFGTQRGDETGSQSALICFDGLGAVPDGRTEIRDGVSIDAATGTAAKHKKYEVELLPCGTTFPLRVELLVGEDADEGELMSLLVAALEGLRPGGITLGARRSRGLGQVEAHSWQAHRYDLTTGDGWLVWLLSDPLAPIPGQVAEHADPATASTAAAPTDVEITDAPDQRRKLTVEAALQIDRGLLVRSSAAAADAPDAAHLVSGGQSVLPGTGLAGMLRARAFRILDVLGVPEPGEVVDALFGPRLGNGASDQDVARASRLRVSESTIADGERVRQTRIRIDRATQGVIKGALFDEEPQIGGQVDVRLELRDPLPGETGLLLLLLKDLLSGDLPVGGTVSVGRGILRGTADITFPEPEGTCVRVDPGMTHPQLEDAIKELTR